MALTATVIETIVVSAKSLAIRAMYSGNGAQYEMLHYAPTGTDPQAFIDAAAASIEARETTRELRMVARKLLEGVDPGDLTLHLVTVQTARTYALRALFNFARTCDVTEVEKLTAALSVLNNYTDEQVAAQLVGVTSGQVGAWRAKLTALAGALSDYAPAGPEQQ